MSFTDYDALRARLAKFQGAAAAPETDPEVQTAMTPRVTWVKTVFLGETIYVANTPSGKVEVFLGEGFDWRFKGSGFEGGGYICAADARREAEVHLQKLLEVSADEPTERDALRRQLMAMPNRRD